LYPLTWGIIKSCEKSAPLFKIYFNSLQKLGRSILFWCEFCKGKR